jgi:hypothetical protein
MLANWLALIALLALGIVWPPTNTAGALARRHPVVTADAPAELPRVTCAEGGVARTR